MCFVLLVFLESLLLWFEIVLDLENFILLFVKRIVEKKYKIISELQRGFLYSSN